VRRQNDIGPIDGGEAPDVIDPMTRKLGLHSVPPAGAPIEVDTNSMRKQLAE
jgi:hypothetical protein